jgi:hypothetical protein
MPTLPDHLPDWGQPVDAGGMTGFRGHGTRRVLVLPEALVLATGIDGQPEFRLTAVRPMVPGPGQTAQGRLEMALALRSARTSADGLVQAIPAQRGWLVLGAEALDLPGELRAPLELRCSGIGAAELSLPLRPEGLGFVEQALAEGALPVLARADLEVAGIACRAKGRLVVDHARFAAFLAEGRSANDLRAALERDPLALGVEIVSDDPMAVAAAADQLCARMAGGPMRVGADGLVLVWDARIAPVGRSTLDLSQAVVVSRVVQLMLDPFAEARRLAGAASLIHRVTTAPLQAGQHRLTLAANLPRPLAGPLAVGARLVVPAHPPARMHEVREDVEFAVAEPVQRVIRLSPTEAVAWQVEATVWLPTPDGRGARLAFGQQLEGGGPDVDLGPQDFPLHFSRVAASEALLALARVELVLTGGGLTATAVLDALTPQVALALPEAGQIVAQVVAPDGQALVLPQRPAGDWRIELADLPGYGPRITEITVEFPPSVALRAVEVRVDDGTSQPLSFTPARPQRRFDWFCANPFQPGLSWRWQGEGEFVAVKGDRLSLHATEGMLA